MWIISKAALREFWQKHPDARAPLEAWHKATERARWASLADARRTFPHADAVPVTSGHTATVFNIGGNKFRLAAAIHYNTGKVFVLRVMTHAEYGRGRWRDEL